MKSRRMSEIRKQRLLALAAVLAGGFSTLIVVLSPEKFQDADGTLFFPLFAILGVIALIVLRPRRHH